MKRISTTSNAELASRQRGTARYLRLGLVLASVAFGALGFSTSALAAGTQLYGFGYNYWGQLGFTANENPNPVPTLITLPGESGPITHVAEGGGHGLVVTASGQLYGFGYNGGGQLGAPADEGANPVPKQITLPGAIGGVTDAAAGAFDSLAITHDGQLFALGSDAIANATTTEFTLPDSAGSPAEVVAGDYQDLIVTSQGQLYAFGANEYGQLGNSTGNGEEQVRVRTPVLVTLPGENGGVVQAAAGYGFSLALTSTGQLYGFGENLWGQLGNTVNNYVEPKGPTPGYDPNKHANPVPTLVTLPGEIGPIVQIAAGASHSLALTASGQLYAFGNNNHGQLGNAINNTGYASSVNPTPTLVNFPGATAPIARIGAGTNDSLALTANGQLYAWGSNGAGELGSTVNDGSISNSFANPTPSLVALPGPAAAISSSASGESTLVLVDEPSTNTSTSPTTTTSTTAPATTTSTSTTTTTTSKSPTTTTTTTSTSSTAPATTTSTSATTSTKTTTSKSPTTTTTTSSTAPVTTTTTTSMTTPVTSQTITTTTSTTTIPVEGLLLGNETTTYSIADSVNGGREEGFQFTAKATGKIEELEFRTAAGANTGITGVDLGVFAESSGKPGEVLGQGKVSGQPAASSWIKVTGLSINVSSGTKYWLVVLPLGESTKELHYDEAVKSGGTSMAEGSVGGLTSMTAENSWTGYSQGPVGFQAIGTAKSISAPTNKSLPTTSPTAELGHILTATNGSWENEPTSYTYQWERCNTLGVECVNISNPSTASYVPVEADVGHTILVKVTASNSAGSASASSLATSSVRTDPLIQKPQQLTGTEEIGNGEFGATVAVSENGDEAIVGAPGDNGGIGAIWSFERTGGTWKQVGKKVTGTEEIGDARFGTSVAISASGGEVLVGGPKDNGALGAVWLFNLSKSGLSPVGGKHTGSEEVGAAGFGTSVAYENATAVIGGPKDDEGVGAAWVYHSSLNGPPEWRQVGKKLTGSEEVGKGEFGAAVALSQQNNTALIGSPNNEAAYVFVSTGAETWAQQGPELIGREDKESFFGHSLALSAAGNTALIGGYADNDGNGAAWLFKRSGTTWTQEGEKLRGGATALWGASVALAGDGDLALIGHPSSNDGHGASFGGGATVFRVADSALLYPEALEPPTVSLPFKAESGSGVALSATGNVALDGVPGGGSGEIAGPGEVWAYSEAATSNETTTTTTTTTSTSATTTTTSMTSTTTVTSQTTTTSTTSPVKGLLVGNETSTYSVADDVAVGREEGFQFTAKASGKIEELEFRTASAANTGITGVDLGVFAESSGKPGEVLGQGKVSGQPATSSWIKVTGLSINVSSGTKYWLVVLPLGESTKELHYNEAVRSGGTGMAEDSVGGLTSMTAESSWTAYSQGPVGFQAIGP